MGFEVRAFLVGALLPCTLVPAAYMSRADAAPTAPAIASHDDGDFAIALEFEGRANGHVEMVLESIVVPGQRPVKRAAQSLGQGAPEWLLPHFLTPGVFITLSDGTSAVVRSVKKLALPSPPGVGSRVIGWVRRTSTRRTYVSTATDRVEVTPEHRFYVPGKGWIGAESLVRGTLVDSATGPEAVTAVSSVETAPRFVYNLLVEGEHTYRVGRDSLLVHNGDSCLRGPARARRETAPPTEKNLGEAQADEWDPPQGQLYIGTDGAKRNVRTFWDPAQAWCAHLTDKIFRELGVDAPESAVIVVRGKPTYVSNFVENAEELGPKGIARAGRAKAFMKGFAADVLTANYNSLGWDVDRVLLTKQGRLLRADNSGSLIMGAGSGRKDTNFLNSLRDWNGFRTPRQNRNYAAVAKAAGLAHDDARFEAFVEPQIRAVLNLRARTGGWQAFVDQHASGLGYADKGAVVAMLEARTIALAEKLPQQTGAASGRASGAGGMWNRLFGSAFRSNGSSRFP